MISLIYLCPIKIRYCRSFWNSSSTNKVGLRYCYMQFDRFIYSASPVGSMSKTLKLEAKTPKKKLLKKTMTKTRKSDFFLLKTFFLSFYLNFCPYIFRKYNFLSIYFYVKSTFDKEMVKIYVF